MAEATPTPTVTTAPNPAVAPPTNPVPTGDGRIERTRTIPVRSVDSLRAEYDKLARECAEAGRADDKTEVARLIPLKSAAFQAWYHANLSAQTAKK